VAVVCIMHNEEDLVVPFLEHYFGLGVNAVHLVTNDCTDGTVRKARRYPGVVLTDLDSSGQLDDALRNETFQRQREACTGRYEWVVLVDADEFLVPRRGTLQETLARHSGHEVLGSEGYDVIQRPGEPPYDPALPPLAQRRWGVQNRVYNKPAVLRPEGPSRLAPGQHFLLGPRPYPEVSPFYLLHLAGFDEAIFFKRRLQMTTRQGARNIRQGYGVEHTSQTEADVRQRWLALQTHPAQRLLPVETLAASARER
jgi:hypothetical protein